MSDKKAGQESIVSNERTRRKVRTGRVVSDKMNKTRVVLIDSAFQHPMYKKIVRRTSKIKVHDETNESHTGDTVKVMETRPISKDKCWRLVEVVEKAK